MKKTIVCLITEHTLVWLLVLMGLYRGLFIEQGLPFIMTLMVGALWLPNTCRWLLVLFDVVFSTPKTTVTKGFRYALREESNVSRRFTKHFSVISFDDKKLNGEFYYFDAVAFRHGEEIEVTYYPRSKFIKKMKRISAQDKSLTNNLFDDEAKATKTPNTEEQAVGEVKKKRRRSTLKELSPSLIVVLFVTVATLVYMCTVFPFYNNLDNLNETVGICQSKSEFTVKQGRNTVTFLLIELEDGQRFYTRFETEQITTDKPYVIHYDSKFTIKNAYLAVEILDGDGNSIVTMKDMNTATLIPWGLALAMYFAFVILFFRMRRKAT